MKGFVLNRMEKPEELGVHTSTLLSHEECSSCVGYSTHNLAARASPVKQD
jgi:hypothetical protein